MMNLREALEKVRSGDKEAKLDVIANAVSYTLSEATLNTINSECDTFEQEQEEERIQMKYLQILEQLEQKYNN